jgi:3-oxoacyl-[acyl-carrier protein] reductase
MSTPASSPLPLTGRVAIVTGVSRRQGIGYAVARRLAGLGASLLVQHHRSHDLDQPWGGDDLDAVTAGLRGDLVGDARLVDVAADLADPQAADDVVARAVAAYGHVDVLVCNHARSGSDGDLLAVGAATLDTHWQVNARSTLLLTRHFAEQHDGRPGGRVVWMTSGQQLGPMRGEVAYAASKAALVGLVPTVADELVERGILLNAVNPGPVNTGYLDVDTADRSEETLAKVLASFPLGRFGEPDDPARLIAWLATDESRWVVGQVLNTEGGFRRW